MLLSVIIVSYNTKQLTMQTLESVYADLDLNHQLARDTEVIVVDNHSTDGSLASLEQFCQSHPRCQLIVNNHNRGFAAANNQGLRRARGEIYCLLNSDTVVQRGCLTNLVQVFRDHPLDERTANLTISQDKIDRLGILAATLQSPNGAWQPQGGSFPTLLTLFFHMTMLDDLPLIGAWLPSTQHTGWRASGATQSGAQTAQHELEQADLLKSDWVAGTAMAIRRQVVEEIGYFDEEIFMYGEDIEYCLRAAHHHWDCAIATNSVVTHYGSASSSSSQALIGELKSYLYIWSKHQPLWQLPLARALLRLGCRVRSFLFGTMIGDRERAALYQQALREL